MLIMSRRANKHIPSWLDFIEFAGLTMTLWKLLIVTETMGVSRAETP